MTYFVHQIKINRDYADTPDYLLCDDEHGLSRPLRVLNELQAKQLLRELERALEGKPSNYGYGDTK